MSVLGKEQRLMPPLLSEPGDIPGPDRVMRREDRYTKVHSPILATAPSPYTRLAYAGTQPPDAPRPRSRPDGRLAGG